MLTRLSSLIFFLLQLSLAIAADPLSPPLTNFPALATLYQKYPSYHAQLSSYAIQQGFSNPIEILATEIHELIHIDSAAHQAFNISGNYFDPYLTLTAWPVLTNREVSPYITSEDTINLGPIYSTYLHNTPKNKLSNVLDEINAYTQTVPFICASAPSRAPVHLQALIGHLTLADIYLRILATRFPNQYQKLAANRVARGALETIIANAYVALNTCYRAQIASANPLPVPKAATRTFAALPAPR